jgi:pantoate kinase
MHFVPANLSCFFTIHHHPDPRWTGTCGVGFTVNQGVEVAVTKQKQPPVTMSYNGDSCFIPPVTEVCQILGVQGIHIQMNSPFPLGAGFGMSGACTLATAYALKRHCVETRGKASLQTITPSHKQLAILAHAAEAKHKTGLGDIVNQYYKGFLIKTTPSSHFEAERIPVDQKNVYYKIYAAKDAHSVLSSINKNVLNKAGKKALTHVQQEMKNHQPVSVYRIFNISKTFCQEAGLLTNPQLNQSIDEIEKNGGAATRILLGNAVMSTIPFPGSREISISSYS